MYKSFVKKYLFSIITIAILFGLLNTFLYSAPQSTLWIYNCYQKKEKYSKNNNDKKIIIASGSNTLFGLEANLIEKELGLKAVNLAVHAGLKTDYIIYKVKQNVNSGDIVILPFEYQNYSWKGEQSNERTAYILTRDKFYLLEMNLFDVLKMIYSIDPLGLLKSIRETYLMELKEMPLDVGYNSVSLNINGDHMYKNGNKKKDYKPFDDLVFNENDRGLIEIYKFNEWCKMNNVTLYLTYPNTVYQNAYVRDNNYIKYFNDLDSFLKKHYKVIGKPNDFFFPKEYFYDSTYHMNNDGAVVRTYQFIEYLKQELIN